jgi:hypothetical protein
MNFDTFVKRMAAQMAAAEVGVRRGDGRQAGIALLAAQYGILDAAFIPQNPPFVLASGHSNPKHVDGPSARHSMHQLDCIPDYDQIPHLVADIVSESNTVRRLRAWGMKPKDTVPQRLSIAITGCVYALTLFHLWNGDDVRRLRFKALQRKGGRVFANVPKWRHHSAYQPYWGLAWQMHADGTKHANLCAYLSALCLAFKQYTGQHHVGWRVRQEIERLQAEECAAYDGVEWTEADAEKERILNQRSAS